MAGKSDGHMSSPLSGVVALLLGLPWVEILTDAWRVGKRILRGLSSEGMYEVLDYETTLDIQDPKGKKAILKKQMKVRYLQDNIIAFQDFAWGEGKILQNYKSSPGIKVDQYNLGYKTYVLLSLRDVKNKGEVDEHNIEWEISNGFLKPDGYWVTEIANRMKQVKVQIVFPTQRPPTRIFIVENNRRRTQELGKDSIKRMADGRWQVLWTTEKPKLYEHYILKWNW